MGAGKQGMTRARLGQYRILCRELALLEDRIKAQGYVSDSVRGSTTEPHYTEHAIKITGIDAHAMRRLQRKRTAALQERAIIERYVDGVQDGMLRVLITARYIRGASWAEVAKEAGGNNTRDGVRMMVKRFVDGR